jgi:hypothetical protein
MIDAVQLWKKLTGEDANGNDLFVCLSSVLYYFWFLLTRKVHSTSNTQQAEQSWLHTRREQKTCQSIFPEN